MATRYGKATAGHLCDTCAGTSCAKCEGGDLWAAKPEPAYMQVGAAAHPGPGAAVIGRAQQGSMVLVHAGLQRTEPARVLSTQGMTVQVQLMGGEVRKLYARDVARAMPKPCADPDGAMAKVIAHATRQPGTEQECRMGPLRVVRLVTRYGHQYLRLDCLRGGWHRLWATDDPLLLGWYDYAAGWPTGKPPLCPECLGAGYEDAGQPCAHRGCRAGARATMRENGKVLEGDTAGWHQLHRAGGWARRYTVLREGDGGWVLRLPDAMVTPYGVLHHAGYLAPPVSTYRSPADSFHYTVRVLRTGPGYDDWYMHVLPKEARSDRVPHYSRAVAEAKLADNAAQCCTCGTALGTVGDGDCTACTIPRENAALAAMVDKVAAQQAWYYAAPVYFQAGL